jgi:alcohol dehydrogenase
MYGLISTEATGLWGGYATHQYLAPDSLLLPVPDSLGIEVAVAFNPWCRHPVGVTVAGTKPGDVVAVLGCGIRGLSAAAAPRRRPAPRS